MKANAVEIAEALAQIRDLQDESGRATFVQAIGAFLGRPLLPEFHSSPKLYLLNVVVKSLAFDDGMDALLKAVDFIAGDTHAAAIVRRLASPAEELLESTAESQIKDMLEGLSMPSLTRIFHAVTEDAAAPAPSQFGDAWQAFSVLLDVNTRADGLPPHLVFIALLIRALERSADFKAARADGPLLSERLGEWMTDQLRKLHAIGGKAAVDRLERIRAEKDLQVTSENLPIYLIIQMEPVGDGSPDQGRIRVSHWRQVHPFEWRPVRGEDQVVPRAEVPQCVSELIEEAEGGWAYQLDDSLVLEFVLPYSLLDLAPDEWTRDPPEESDPTPLGTEYELVIRSHERMYRRTLHRAWRRRWRTLLDEDECRTLWPDPKKPIDPIEFRNKLMQEDKYVSCVLDSPPDREPGNTQLRMALRTGIPIILWDRGRAFAQESKDVLCDALDRPDALRLPAEIKKLRLINATPHDRPDRPSVTLMFDNPEHFLETTDALHPPE